MDFIYLDHNSTTPIDPRVAETIFECHREGYVNPASQHRMGQTARRMLESKRARILEVLGAKTAGMDADRLIFTSGGTESNNLAIFGIPDFTRKSVRILLSAVEHPSVLAAGEKLKRDGVTIELVPVDELGCVRLDALEQMLETPTDLVSIMLANNETGVLQPVREAAKLCRNKSVLIHTDAVQAIGKIPVGFRDLGVDAMTFTPHKFHGPRGIGGLVVRHEIQPNPFLFGGFQQMGTRPGTEDVAQVVGTAKALEIFEESGVDSAARMHRLRQLLQTNIHTEFNDVVINGYSVTLDPDDVQRVPHTVNFSFPGVNRQAFLMAADLNGLAISTGSACASGSSERSHVLIAMGATEEVIEGSIRISLGIHTTVAEIEEASRRIIKIVNDLRQ